MTFKVLIVDDSKLARMSVVKALEGILPDAERIEAARASAALSAVERDAPNIALIDYNMPERDGLLLAADLLERDPHLQVAIISANHQEQIVNRTRALGATFLPKPLKEGELRSFLDGAMQRLSGDGS